MNVLFVNNFRGRGGGEEFLRDLLPGLVQKGVRVGLVCRPGTPLEGMFRNSKVALYPIKRSGIGVLTSLVTIARIIRRESYEIVNIQRGHDIIQSWFAARLSGRRPVLIYTPQVPEFIRSRFLLGRMDAVVTISRFIRNKLTDFYPAIARRVSVIYYGIDLDKFQARGAEFGTFRKRFGLGRDTKLIGTVGDLWKNQIEFLDALVAIKERIADVRYVLVAADTDAPLVEEFKRRAATLGLSESIVWAGRLPKDEMIAFYRDIDLVVSTHRNEGFGIWILEAMAMGNPAVAYHAGGIPDSLEGCPGGTLISGGPREMADTVVGLLSDAASYEALSKAGPRWVDERFSKERMINQYDGFFQSLLTARGKFRYFAEKNAYRILMMISKNDRYGAQRIFLDQVSILSKQGHHVLVAARGERGFVADAVRAMGVPYHGMPMQGLSDMITLRRLVKEHAIDMIHTTLDRADYFGLLLGKISGRPVVSTMMVPRYHPGFRFMNHVIVLSHMQKRLLVAHRVRPDAVSVIRPGVDVQRFSNPDPARREVWKQKISTDQYSIIFSHVASIIPRKGHLLSLDLTAACKKRGERPLLIIIGDSPREEYQSYYDLMNRTIQKQGLGENVFFAGWAADVPELLSLSHFTLLPSEREALGIVLMEGMAAGTPVVAREGEGGAEIVAEYGAGFLYKPHEGLDPLVDKIIALAHDRLAYQRFSDKCRSVIRDNFSLAQFGEQILRVYSKADANIAYGRKLHADA